LVSAAWEEKNEKIQTALWWSERIGADRVVEWAPEVIEQLQERVAAADRVVMHNAIHDIPMLASIGVTVEPRKVEDTLLLAHVLMPEKPKGLKPLCKEFLGIGDDDQKELLDDVKHRRGHLRGRKKEWKLARKETHGSRFVATDMWLSPRMAARYARRDAERTLALWECLNEELAFLAVEPRLREVYRLEKSLLWVLLEMKRYGITCFPEKIERLEVELAGYMEAQRVRAYGLGYEGLNFQSTRQMVKAFCQDGNLVPAKFTPTGRPKIDAEQLLAWATSGSSVDPCRYEQLARAALEWKAAKKQLEYLEEYRFFMCRRRDGSCYLHNNYRQARAVTGRLSCSDPNLQQVADPEGGRRHATLVPGLRDCFGPRAGYTWLLFDYGQLELWVFAFLSGDREMQRALLEGKDFHGEAAGLVWGSRGDWKQKRKAYRARAKMLMFGKIYGGGPGKLAELLRVPEGEAAGYLRDFAAYFPGLESFVVELVGEVRETGILRNIFDREYHLGAEEAYRAVNYKVQGSCADLLKRAMVRIGRPGGLLEDWPHAHLVASIHDEIIVEVWQGYRGQQLQDLKESVVVAMQKDSHRIPGLRVPLPITVEWTDTTWSDARELGECVRRKSGAGTGGKQRQVRAS
jgi:DNA polymerase-1